MTSRPRSSMSLLLVLALAVAVPVQRAAAYISYTNGSELNIEARWPPEGPRCCHDIPAGNMSSVDSFYAVFTEPGCKLGSKTCKWPAVIKSIWTCGCEGQTPLQMPDNTWTGCCGRVAIKDTGLLGSTTKIKGLKTNCTAYDDRTMFYGLGVIAGITCSYDPKSGFITGLKTTYGPAGKRQYSQLRGGSWGNTTTSVAISPDDKLWELGVRADPITGGIKFIKFISRNGKSWVCGDAKSTIPIKWVLMASAYRSQNQGLKLEALWYKYREFVASWKGTQCLQGGRPMLGTLSPIWGRDSTYYSYPGIANGVGYINPDVSIPIITPVGTNLTSRYWLAPGGFFPNSTRPMTDPKPNLVIAPKP